MNKSANSPPSLKGVEALRRELADADNGPAKAEASPAPLAQLDHDGDGSPGGAAEPPAEQHLVVLKDHKTLGLSHGEVIAVSPADAKDLLSRDVARNATDAEVELAQPRVRVWSPNES